MIATQVLSAAIDRLIEHGVPDAARDARKLLRHAAGGEIASIDMQAALPEGQVARFAAMIDRRVDRQPVSQIIGYREFWGREFRVTGATLDPRPDSELIVEHALSLFPAPQILDLGTGTGCLLISLLCEWTESTGLGVDLSTDALEVARQNADAFELKDRVQFKRSNWFSEVTGIFDLVICNPPYISASEMKELQPEVRNWEPRIALTPEGDGLDAYRAISANLTDFMTPKATAILEIGSKQAADVSSILRQAGFSNPIILKDLNQLDRAIVVEKSS